ncbi:MAG: EamA family transporter, partial [Hyphomicrobiales bacterium]
FNPLVMLGMCTFVVSMASHLIVLSRVDLSFAYPFLSLAYVVATAYAFFVFQEDVSVMRMAGIALICAGTFFIAQS